MRKVEHQIIVVDDDPVLRTGMNALARHWQLDNVKIFNNADMALNALSLDTRPALLLVDWEMPGLNGIELIKILRDRDPNFTPYIILLSARNDDEDVIKGLDSGANDYISKPFHAGVLKARIDVGLHTLSLQTRLRDAVVELEKYANYDELTGIYNRRIAISKLSSAMYRRRHSPVDRALGVAIIDVDFFKRVNDTHGHAAGDKVLKTLASLLNDTIRPNDILGRLGGEEFLLVIDGDSKASVTAALERIRKSVEAMSVTYLDNEIQCTASIGACVYHRDNLDVEEVLRYADESLYQAKHNGRNQVVVSETE